MLKIIAFTTAALLLVPMFSSAADLAQRSTADGELCLVPIFHTDFEFPPEGGQILQIGDQLYFNRVYLPGCENMSSLGTVLPGHGVVFTSSGTVPAGSATPSVVSEPVANVAVPRTSPVTGCTQ